MIILICPECSSENVIYASSKAGEDFFACEDCRIMYSLSETGWKKKNVKNKNVYEDKIYVYADGGCRGNQSESNIGGWGAVLKYKNHLNELRGSTKNTTNNIMELTSCIEALKAINDKDIPVEVTMDSQYVIKGINEWIYGWIKRGWITSQKKPVENKDLWQELYDLKNEFSNIEFKWCKGHSDNEGNNRADELANMAMDEEMELIELLDEEIKSIEFLYQ